MPSHLQGFLNLDICDVQNKPKVLTEHRPASMNKSLDINSSAVQRFELSSCTQPQFNQMYFAVKPWCRVAVHWMVTFK